tara:strand:+ start:1320 stop:2738 length:1419 start_codon:yes stop_codon:yes gene_type:complete
MVLNPFFQQGSKSEQSLVQSLINEQLKIYGVDVHFMPRKYVSSDSVLREVSASSFEDAYPIEAYIDNFDGYGDNPTLLSKFGIEQTNEITLIISKERFENYISPLMKNEENIKLSTRPKEGDLIYFPFGDRLFEIKYVEHEKPFYMLKNTYVYELRCELFRYEDEVIDTGVDEIDDTLEATEGVDGADFVIGTTQKLTLVGDAVQATAETTQVHGGIQFVTVTNRGSGYKFAPRVAISSAPAGGVTGIATASLLGGLYIGAGYDAASNTSVVQEVNLVNPGSGYTTGPEMQFYGGGGTGLAVTSYMANGTIGIVTVTGGGSGYTTSPSVTFTGLSTVSAAATAVVSTAGTISAIHITNAGAGYTTPPTISIAAPIGTSTGTFVFNEIVTGGTSGATARVRTWNSVTNEIEISNVEGTFSISETLTGSTSGASRVVRLIDLTNYDDGFGDNDVFETEADDILDFSEGNPFGTP